MYSTKYQKQIEFLVCPETKQGLQLLSLDEAEVKMSCKLESIRVSSQGSSFVAPEPIGPTPYVLVREDLQAAYPIVDDIPILLIPEMLGGDSQKREFDLLNSVYAEAYEEMEHYNRVAQAEAENISQTNAYLVLQSIPQLSAVSKESFPIPISAWIDAVYDCGGQADAYGHIAPVVQKRILQIGGKGTHITKFLLAGASEGWALSPMIGELLCAVSLAKAYNVADSLRCVVAVAEELPFRDESFDAIYSGGCIHHTVTSRSLPEAARVLAQGGKFAAVDPWKTPIHELGTRVFGKREKGVYCRPIDRARAAPLKSAFVESETVHHGAIFRYPLLVLQKLGVSTPLPVAWRLSQADDTLSSLLPKFRNAYGGSVTLLGTKS